MNIFILFAGFLIILYFLVIRDWQLTWGATKEETTRLLLGDDIVQKPHFIATRALSIKALHDEIWKWIIKLALGGLVSMVSISSTMPMCQFQEIYYQSGFVA